VGVECRWCMHQRCVDAVTLASAHLRPCAQNSVNYCPRTSADVQRRIAICKLQCKWYTPCRPTTHGNCLCLERGFATNSLFRVTCYSYYFNLKKSKLNCSCIANKCRCDRPTCSLSYRLRRISESTFISSMHDHDEENIHEATRGLSATARLLADIRTIAYVDCCPKLLLS